MTARPTTNFVFFLPTQRTREPPTPRYAFLTKFDKPLKRFFKFEGVFHYVCTQLPPPSLKDRISLCIDKFDGGW